MSILVTGANGQVGRECMALGAIGLTRQMLDITQPQDLLPTLQAHKARLVINAAAYTAVDKAESEPQAAFAANHEGARRLAEACARGGIPIIHLSTDYVFDGSAAHAYRPTDIPNPQGVYALSKWRGEEAVRAAQPQHLILRVSWVFGQHGNNFVKTILRLAQEKPELRVVADQHGCPTHAAAIAQTLMQLAQRWISGQSMTWGTYHYCGSPVTTWHGFAQAIVAKAVQTGWLVKAPRIVPITTAEYPTAARRPFNSRLDCASLETAFGIIQPDWHVGLSAALQQLKLSFHDDSSRHPCKTGDLVRSSHQP